MVYAESRLQVGNPSVQPEHHDKSAENSRSFPFVPDVFKKFTGRLSFLTLRGRAATDDCLRRLGRHLYVKAVVLPKDKQPDMMDREEVVMALLKGTATREVRSPT